MSDDDISPITRRKALKAAAVGPLMGIAGCTGGGGETPTATEENGGGTPTATEEGKETATTAMQGDQTPGINEFVARLKGIFPKDAQFNPFNPKNQAWQINEVIFDRLLYWDAQQDYWPQIAQEWSVPERPKKGSTATITLRNDPPHTWHNGDPVVARDVLTGNLIGKEFGFSLWNYVSEANTKDKFTIEYTINQKVNSSILKSIILQQGPQQIKHSLYKKNLEKIQDATTDKALNNAKSELQSRTIGLDKVIGNGAFVPMDATSKKFFCERYEDYQAVAETEGVDSINSVDWDVPNFQKYTFLFANEDQALPLFKSEKLDGSRTGQIEPKDLPSSYAVRPFLNDLGESFGFNLKHDVFGRRNIRKAMANIVNRRIVVKAMKPSIPKDRVPVETPTSQTGMADNHAKKWLGDDYENFNFYNAGRNPEKKLQRARDLLKQEGFSEQKDSWVKDDGTPWAPEFKAPTYWEKSMSPTVNLLNRFGIKATLTVQDAGTYWGKTIPNGDFGGIGYIWISQSGSIMATPWHAYMGELKTETVNPDRQDGALRIPRKPKIPGTIGDESSQMETVNIPELVTQLSKPLPQDELQQKVKRAAWTFNQLIPNIQLRRFVVQQTIDPVNFKWPSKDSRLDTTLLWQSPQITHAGFRAKWESEM